MDEGSALSEEDAQVYISGPWLPIFDREIFSLGYPNFDEEEIGPQNINPNMSPLEYFMMFLNNVENDTSILEILVRETNRYGDVLINERSRPPRQIPPYSRLRGWSPVDKEEMRVFIGLLFAMGIVKKPCMTSYWEKNARSWFIETANISKIMSRNRFQLIMQFLHLNNNSNAIARGRPGYNPLYKIQPAINHFNGTFGKNYRLNCNICVDERIVGFKGRHHLKQYLPKKKKNRWGAKLWVLSDSKSGYTYKINVYKGKSDEARHVNGQGYKTVMELLQGHFHREHHLTIDSFFTSPTLVHDLARMGTHVTGSVIVNRKGMPGSFKRTRLEKGKMIARVQGPVMAILWSDRKQLYILTTIGNPRMVRTQNAKGKDIVIPQAIRRYNYCMGGVDRGDQLLSSYEPSFRSVKLWKKMLFNLLSTAAVNAYICYRDTFLIQTKMSHYQFHVQLVNELIGNYRRPKRAIGRPPVNLYQPHRLTERHFPDIIPNGGRKQCEVCARRNKLQGRYKKSRIQTWCPDCGVGLCIKLCFRRYHTRLAFEE